MSCLSLKLPPAPKVWKSFTSRLQSKLHKLHMSKAIKKPRNRVKKSTGGGGAWPSLLIDQRLKRRKRHVHAHRAHPLREYFFEKKTAPVFVDKLFKGPVAELVAEPCPPKGKNFKLLDQPAAVQESGGLAEKTFSADDLWESLGLASPQMRGVDERAEEFITRFRAEMEVQEMLARDS
ncbi:hypothetical protein CJ030_MR0G005872 [Morella rubra]|uniref:Uncharacterized protein n=1 Tax=Morella rubra TaxID=262757 RepID=A0A6A1UL81_9ROSI|nr:hypothetical protein CJ030_MR0G005872 [Morella rubra]